MSQFPHDEFAKNLFELLLTPFGAVEIERGVQPEAKAVDIYFQPSQPIPTEHNLGLLARCITQPAIFEPFRNPVGVGEIQMWIAKLFEILQELTRERKRLKQPDLAEVKPHLWILTPTLAAPTLTGFGSVNRVETWGQGVYLLPTHFQTGIIVIHQLPRTPETLWFRLMGKGTVQENAIGEVADLPANSPYKGNALDLFLSLKLELESKQSIEPEERNLAMRLSALYIEKIQEAQQIGRQEGRTEGERELVMVLLTEKLGNVSARLSEEIAMLSVDKLQELAKALLCFSSIADLTQWLTNNR
ncbi:DUF4351 domain-containing protein [Chamaesiphon minutus]|uniref:DUF4351 domain-containing protein n=1 Tax=Chamaesiphon minutus (strain ATCC 27169 / PCC 6605) TaxID=1173020 RepID=K9U8X3_CHAP6|nr:DUF4351 domain-containing protein [Chamaesiphon minutus]AFY91542.1 hypothetical protein Cha6605_0240 [Chamaesiphon minutus PCC 6605]